MADVAVNWEITQANQSNDYCSLATSQGKKTWYLVCIYSNMQSLENKHSELDLQLESWGIIGVTET